MKKTTKPLPDWAVGVVQKRLWESRELQVENSSRRRGSIKLAREYIGELKQTVGNRVGEEGSRESEGSWVIFDEAAVEWGVEGLPK